MKNLRRNFNRFCIQNRDKGIPNLMLYIVLGSGLVYFFSLINGGNALYQALCFDKDAILHGQIWRLFTYMLTYSFSGNPVLNIIFLFFFYRLGQAVEHAIGTLRFNLFYLGGMIMMDIFALIFCPTQAVTIGGYLIDPASFTYFYSNMSYYLHLSMILAYATAYPDSQFMLMFIIPVRAWLLALIYLILVVVDIFNMCYPLFLFPHCLFPLIGLLNYFVFFGDKMPNLLPLSWKAKLRKKRGPSGSAGRGPIPYHPPQHAKQEVHYTHRCAVCGRTDVTNPELEFRYCSRCNGYHCYCEDHINNHAHIE